MKAPKWTVGGATVPTTTGTVISLLAAPMAGLGLMAGLFGAWVAGSVMMSIAAMLWLAGRWLLAR